MFSVLSNILQKICKDSFLIPIYDLWLSKFLKFEKFAILSPYTQKVQ